MEGRAAKEARTKRRHVSAWMPPKRRARVKTAGRAYCTVCGGFAQGKDYLQNFTNQECPGPVLDRMRGLGHRLWCSPDGFVICMLCGGISDQAEGAKTAPKLLLGTCSGCPASRYSKQNLKRARAGLHPRTGAPLGHLAPQEEQLLAAQLAGTPLEEEAEGEEMSGGGG